LQDWFGFDFLGRRRLLLKVKILVMVLGAPVQAALLFDLLYFSPQMYFNSHRRKCTAFLRKISILSPHKIHLSQ
jgi:hypothetical protein